MAHMCLSHFYPNLYKLIGLVKRVFSLSTSLLHSNCLHIDIIRWMFRALSICDVWPLPLESHQIICLLPHQM